jgi:hypothetical protein
MDDLAKKKREMKKQILTNKWQSKRFSKTERSFPYLCSSWVLQKMARSSTDVCLRSSQGETDPGRIVRDPESILVSGAEDRAVNLLQRQQE